MPELSSSKILSHRFRFDEYEVRSGIRYDMIIGCNLMVQLGLFADFKRQFLQWDGVTIPMRYPISLLGKTDLTSFEVRDVVMHTT